MTYISTVVTLVSLGHKNFVLRLKVALFPIIVLPQFFNSFVSSLYCVGWERCLCCQYHTDR